ncbi:MAG: PAS domain-containing sensor histidine kinase [Chlorobi bacterium]|nr:PAS domain-containing sensor histidine kinase [Chlorobiota bacterium]
MKNSDTGKIKILEEENKNLRKELDLLKTEVKYLHRRYSDIYHHVPIGIVLFDKNLKVIDFNETFLKIFNLKSDEIRNFNLKNIADKRILPAFEQVFKGFDGFYDGAYRTTFRKLDLYISVHTKPFTFEYDNTLINGGIAIFKDVTENTLAEGAVNKSYDTFQRVTDNVNAMIYVIDPQTMRILFMNKKANEVFGEKSGKICYKEFFGKETKCRICRAKILEENNTPTGKFFEAEYFEKRTKQWFHISYGFIEWIDNRKVMLVTSIDISEAKKVQQKFKDKSKEYETALETLKEQNERIHRQSEELKVSSAIKDTMFSIIAHDLRGPVGNITTALDIIRDDINELDKNEILEIIKPLRNSASAAYNLLVNLLFWAKNESGETFFIKDEILLNDIIDDVLILFGPNIEAKNINFVNKTDKEYYLSADEHMINTVIRNLISNAVKYTEENGNIIVNTEKTKGKNNKEYVKFTVKDDGIGISKENIAKILNSKEFFSTYGTNREKGTGIGIILIKDFVEKHNGYIEIKSETGKGTEISVFLPIE